MIPPLPLHIDGYPHHHHTLQDADVVVLRSPFPSLLPLRPHLAVLTEKCEVRRDVTWRGVCGAGRVPGVFSQARGFVNGGLER